MTAPWRAHVWSKQALFSYKLIKCRVQWKVFAHFPFSGHFSFFVFPCIVVGLHAFVSAPSDANDALFTRYCITPASAEPFKWPDSIVDWPVSNLLFPSGCTAFIYIFSEACLGHQFWFDVFGQLSGWKYAHEHFGTTAGIHSSVRVPGNDFFFPLQEILRNESLWCQLIFQILHLSSFGHKLRHMYLVLFHMRQAKGYAL